MEPPRAATVTGNRLRSRRRTQSRRESSPACSTPRAATPGGSSVSLCEKDARCLSDDATVGHMSMAFFSHAPFWAFTQRGVWCFWSAGGPVTRSESFGSKVDRKNPSIERCVTTGLVAVWRF